MPEKKFFGMKNSEGVLRGSPPTPPREETLPMDMPKESPRAEPSRRASASMSRPRHSTSRRSGDDNREKLQRAREQVAVDASKAAEEMRRPPEDGARRARQQARKQEKDKGKEKEKERERERERGRDKAKELEKKESGGIRGVFKRLFTN
jgi:hypothetical protein